MTKKIFYPLMAVLLSLGSLFQTKAEEAQKREMRATWLATVMNIDWPNVKGTSASVIASQKKSLTDYLDGFKNTNINAVCIQVRSMCDAMYKSSYEPWSSYLTGSRGTDPGWDPLAFAVEECHKRGIECHAWVNPYRFSRNNGTDWTTSQDVALKNSGILLSYGGTVVLNPGLPAARERIVNVCKEMITKYDIDGIIFDDYFYPSGIPATSEADDYDLWKNSGTTMSFADWRRDNVNQMVRDVFNMIQATKPYVRFAIGPAGVAGTAATSAAKHNVDPCPTGSDWQYNSIYSDPVAWLEDGTIDYISPQLYWKTTHATNPFGTLTKWWSYVAHHFGRHHYASHNIYFMASTNTQDDWDEILKQISYSREYNEDNAPGVNFYSSRYINGPTCTGFGDYLRQKMFQHKSIPPALTWKEKTSYNAPQNLKLTGNVLSWTGVDKSLIKYSVYAIPTSVSPDSIKSTKFDGIKSDYLLQLTYEPTFTLDNTYLNGYWFAVCVVDGFNNEFDAAYLNAPVGDADKVTLVSPVNGAETTWSQKFSWTAADKATFALQIAEDSTFSKVVIEKNGITANEATVDLSTLESSRTYYWRISTAQPLKLDKKSDYATFTTKAREKAPATTLLAPVGGAEVADNFNFECSKVDADTYTAEVSGDENFTTIKYSSSEFAESDGKMKLACATSTFGKGTFYWRVRTNAVNCDENVSASASFKITSVATGNTEPGYVIKKDIDTYDKVGDFTLTSQWFRSVNSSYDNMTFENSGSLNRGFTVKGNCVYVSGRSENSSSATPYLRVYNAFTGEWVKDLTLGEAAQVSYFPCNDVFTDSAGNVIISNLVLNISNTPLVLFQVDTETGAVTTRASVTAEGTSTVRIDHCNVLGDISSGNFCIFAAMSRGTQIIRWKYVNGALADTKVVTVSAFSPSSNDNFGTAPRVYPVTENLVYVNGGLCDLTRYNMTTGAIDDSFDNNNNLRPIGIQANGSALFSFAGKNFMLNTYGDFGTSAGHQYMLAMNSTGTDFAHYTSMWTFPTRGIGAVNSSTWSAPCCAVPTDDKNVMNLYIYVAGNGLAAYTLTNGNSGVNGIDADGSVGVRVSHGVVYLSKTVDKAELIDNLGRTVVAAGKVNSLNAAQLNGIYVLRCTLDGVTTVKKVVL
jgi:uncharacterized lipoprotein YddW (UPF0748 family)